MLKSTHALWVDENDDCQYYVDYPEGGSSWGCRVFRGQDPFGVSSLWFVTFGLQLLD